MSNSLFNPDYEMIQIENGMVTVAKTCSVKKISYAVTVTEKAWDEWKAKKKPVQEVFPELDADAREFLLTGMTPDEWYELFGLGSDGSELDGEF